MFNALVDFINEWIWSSKVGPFALIAYMLIGAGLYLTIKLRAVQFRLFGHMAATLKHTLHHTSEGISGFQAFSTSLASRVGVGNIVGVATALIVGGPGAIFWMWVVALVGMATSLVESTLAQVYKVTDEHEFRGGPAYYIRHGLGNRFFAGLVAVLTVAAYLVAYGPIQANAMSASLDSLLGWEAWVSGLVIAVASAVVILGGIRRISRVAEVLVPFMALAYVGMVVVVLLTRLDRVPDALLAIVQGAFGAEQLAGGFIGGGIAIAIQMGVARGLFSNEAGLGTTPNAAGAATVPHPATQGMAQGFGVFIDTIVICTATALTILVSGIYTPGLTEDDAATLTSKALEAELGSFGGNFATVALLLFAFTSIIAFGYFIENNFAFLGVHHLALKLTRVLFVVLLFAGAVRPAESVWAAGDAFLGLMGVSNLVAVLLLSGVAVRVIADYEAHMKRGAEPEFDPDGMDLRGEVDAGAWPSRQTDVA